MTPQNRKDLEYLAKRLARFPKTLKGVGKIEFDINCYANKNAKSCGTHLCIAGFAGMLPKFQKRGLHTSPEDNSVIFDEFQEYLDGVCFSNRMFSHHAAQFFGLTRYEADWFFYKTRNLKEIIQDIKYLIASHPESLEEANAK